MDLEEVVGLEGEVEQEEIRPFGNFLYLDRREEESKVLFANLMYFAEFRLKTDIRIIGSKKRNAK